ncbi:GAF and ANTAR domain-containing protein [Phytohabitans sp. LJ34]|uniref:GAF and ANTAR domain-containing protein n=1 Tax=Phytohabitans sp. LJ34 TaxID=3452217 RepID=UPI003F88710C
MSDDLLPIAHELAEITRLVEADDFGATLDRFVTRVVHAIPGCDRALITVRSRGVLETVTDIEGLGLDPIAAGPIVEAATFDEPRRLDDVAVDQRWPSFSAQLAGAGFASCMVLPLSTSGDETAVLTLLSATPGQFTDTAYDVVLLLTLHAGVVFDNAALYHDSGKLVGQLRAALDTRSLVGRAQGMVMRQFNIDSKHAFDTLKRSSQNSNTKLRDLAGLLIAAHEQGEFEDALIKLAVTASR